MSAGEIRGTNYDSVAATYDRRYALQSYDGIRDVILSFLAGVDRAAVLEVGCGTGHWLQIIRDRVHLTAGMDLSANMLARARDTAPGVPLVRARAEHIPFHDGSFDRIVCVNALHHFSSRGQF